LGLGHQPLFCERPARVGFKMFFEFKRSIFVRESTVPDQFQGLELSGVGGLARIMFGHPPLQIDSCADILLLWQICAADDVDVPPACSRKTRDPQRTPIWSTQPVFARVGYAGHASPLFAAAPRIARRAKRGGARRDRTADLLHAMQALSQLSYGPLTGQRTWAVRRRSVLKT
jgi:hypothetical protein